MYVKRLQTPNKAGDDGWKSVLAEGRPLAELRARFAGMNPAGARGAPEQSKVRAHLLEHTQAARGGGRAGGARCRPGYHSATALHAYSAPWPRLA